MESKFNNKKSLIFFSSLCIFSFLNFAEEAISSQPELAAPLTTGHKSGRPALQIKITKALSDGDAKQLEAIIIENKLDMKANIPTLSDQTVMGFVISTRNVKNFRPIIEMLQKLGADIKSPQGDILGLKEYPFHKAVNSYVSMLSGKPDLDRLRILKELGADINARNMGDWTPLMQAVRLFLMGLSLKEVNLEIIAELLKLGADVNAADNEGDTPLHYAVRAGDLRLLQLLHDDFKADINKRNKGGLTPLDYAKDDETKAYLSSASNKSTSQDG